MKNIDTVSTGNAWDVAITIVQTIGPLHPWLYFEKGI
jgi:hypothetical protein